MDTTLSKEYIGWAEQAKMIKHALKGRWPAVKFSVKSSSYAGGASIRVHWTDGPSTETVKKVTYMYEGSEFDAMEDIKNSKETILAGPDGMRRVHFLGDYVFCSRDITGIDSLASDAEKMIREKCVVKDDRFGNFWVPDLARAMCYAINFDKGETLETAFKRVVIRENI